MRASSPALIPQVAIRAGCSRARGSVAGLRGCGVQGLADGLRRLGGLALPLRDLLGGVCILGALQHDAQCVGHGPHGAAPPLNVGGAYELEGSQAEFPGFDALVGTGAGDQVAGAGLLVVGDGHGWSVGDEAEVEEFAADTPAQVAPVGVDLANSTSVPARVNARYRCAACPIMSSGGPARMRPWAYSATTAVSSARNRSEAARSHRAVNRTGSVG